MKRTVRTNSEEKPLFALHVSWKHYDIFILLRYFPLRLYLQIISHYTHPEFKPALPLDGRHGLHSKSSERMQ